MDLKLNVSIMSTLKTQINNASVKAFLNSVPHPVWREDAPLRKVK